MRSALRSVLIASCIAALPDASFAERPAGIWISPNELQAISVTGPAWRNLKAEADQKAESPDLADQNDRDNVRVLAKALIYARARQEVYRQEVIAACLSIAGTEDSATTLALGRELIAYVIAADLVRLPKADDQSFRAWLRSVRHKTLKNGRTLVSTHEDRPNNWGTHAGASRVAIAVYLRDKPEIAKCARILKGWLGDRRAYSGFKYGNDLSWQAMPQSPIGINPRNATKQGHSIDGVLADDQRRGGSFAWPPSKENYVYEGLQGALAQAVILHRVGYDVWNWEDKALLRAFEWLHTQAKFPAVGDDTWQPHIINHYYKANFPAPIPTRPGKNVGWTDWTHSIALSSSSRKRRNSRER